MNIAAHHFMKRALPGISNLSIIKICRLGLNGSKIKQASGFHSKNFIVIGNAVKTPMGQ